MNAGGLVYHVLNRSNARMQMFEHAGDYEALERVLAEAGKRVRMRLLAYCLMPNHWHLVLWPRADGDLSKHVGWLTLTHTQRWHANRHNQGSGHLYQGRFKSFVVESDEHLLAVWRYVERNPLRAGLVDRAEDWRWSSAWRRRYGDAEAIAVLNEGPVERPRNWWQLINRPQTDAELAAIRRAVKRGSPYGSAPWTDRMIAKYCLEVTTRPRGRPRNQAL